MGDGAQVEEGILLIKQLGACHQSTRNKALCILLKTWLPSQRDLPEDDMRKLWKALFYCVWHADKLPVQSLLIDGLSSLLLRLHLPLSLHYFSVFLLTMRREWPGIDALRLDKFYLLIRRFLHHSFVFLKNSSWDLELSRRLMGVLVKTTFFSDDKFRGVGVNYHIASVFLEELRLFLPVRSEIVEVLLEPFVSVMGKLPDKVLLGKIRSSMFEELLKMGKKLLEIKKVGDEVDSGDQAVVVGTIALTMGFSSKFYELGSSIQSCQGNRKVLFGLYEEFSKLEKDLASSGIEVSIPDAVEDDGEEAPSLVPISTAMEVVGSKPTEVAADAVNVSSDDKPLKKCRKKKKDSGGSGTGKKSKKMESLKKNEIVDMVLENSHAEKENNDVAIVNRENSNDEYASDGSFVTLNESVISNLQMQFENVAAEVGLDIDVPSACELPKIKVNGTVSKKRKRAKSMDTQKSQNPELNNGDAEVGTCAKREGKSVKKVRFSMKNNLIWKPQCPLPAQSLRLPPSVTPRGSALKKGVPPGPIREIPPATKKVKQRAVSAKKARKAIKTISPTVKRLKKKKSRST
ncbi:hypothetical protein I3843_08G029600 [Carya illinoinensis]|uniref:Ribosomal RNA processing protein 1 homolog n=1 Tax=Carya illinoinensis TaxID=32201 RepID=A0A8T1PQD5_CARIL|nr:ribosomal RNA processing protein 1 homolog [Carya illinoinensis]KAG2691948.1 hypothetical protein I3760_08G030400 [Carya illinoinensis]KAG2691949.1 hypothetical protein I3760_08G030400 [Carya illinoinensis]KAG6644064.1 hypothetical protein CIPAW_08G029800 [Carya illinoinensis]KAG6698647.1 hypothetical protein I3842_08G030100 [Carya illinoinensis]KAG6698648.1 hypothetical protein I3842_08G030100 [Carya illinoinensis]